MGIEVQVQLIWSAAGFLMGRRIGECLQKFHRISNRTIF